MTLKHIKIKEIKRLEGERKVHVDLISGINARINKLKDEVEKLPN